MEISILLKGLEALGMAKSDLNQEWTKNQIDWHLRDLLFWLKKGQIFTDEQKAKIRELAERIKDGQ